MKSGSAGAPIIVTDATAVAETLGDAEALPADFAGRQRALADHLGLDFSSILFAIAHLPVCQSGERHLATRRRMAARLAALRPEISPRLPDMAERHLAPLFRPGRHDLLNRSLVPLISELLEAITGATLHLAPDSRISGVFSQAMGVAKRRRMEADLAALKERLTDEHGGKSTEAMGDDMALSILGRDAVLGTIGLSLHDHLVGLAGQTLSRHPLPDMPSRTGVPYVDRRRDGKTLRLRLDAFEAGAPRDRQKFFGGGGHTCLGRPLTLDLWQAIRTALAGHDRPMRVTAFRERRDDVFRIPEVFEVEVA